MRRILNFFENYSQPDEPVGKSDKKVHSVLFFGTIVRVLGIVWIGSQSFKVGIVLHLFFLVFLLCEECFEKFSKFFSTGSTGWGIGSSSLLIFVGVV